MYMRKQLDQELILERHLFELVDSMIDYIESFTQVDKNGKYISSIM